MPTRWNARKGANLQGKKTEKKIRRRNYIREAGEKKQCKKSAEK